MPSARSASGRQGQEAPQYLRKYAEQKPQICTITKTTLEQRQNAIYQPKRTQKQTKEGRAKSASCLGMQKEAEAAHSGSSWGSAIPSEGHAGQPVQVSDTGGVASIHQGHVAALHHGGHALLLNPHLIFAASTLPTCRP